MRIVRILRAIALSAVALLLVLFGLVQIEQHLLRNRAERLLADFQSIRLHQSTWADAQALMTRWGAWGHYEGECTASDCVYTIRLSDPISGSARYTHSDRGWALLGRAVRGYELLGGEPGFLIVSFQVQADVIWRSGVGLHLEVPPQTRSAEDYGYVLLLSARGSDSLHAKPRGHWVLGTDDQLANHPFYKYGRPSGCEGCLAGEVTFTPYISPAELKQLTSYDLSCFTRRCLTIPDVLPMAREWHLYPTTEPAYTTPPESNIPVPCAIPVFVRARDASSILLVDAISSKLTSEINFDSKPRQIQTATVRLLQTLKGESPVPTGAVFNAQSWPGGDINYPAEVREQFEFGKRYILFPDHGGPPFQYPENPLSPVELDFCGLVEGTPSTLAEVNKGMAQNDALRRPEAFGSLFW